MYLQEIQHKAYCHNFVILLGIVMDSIKKIVYTNLTDAEFFNINKPRKTEGKGGGQGYIDFSTSMISITEWGDFFSNAIEVTETAGAQNRPRWECPIYNIGIDNGMASNQNITIYLVEQIGYKLGILKMVFLNLSILR